MRIEEHPVLRFERGEKITFFFNGQEVDAHPTETIAAALHAAGIRKLGESPELHRPRGLFCAIGNCSSCFMTVDGQPNMRVCVMKAKPGMHVEEQHGKGALVPEHSQSKKMNSEFLIPNSEFRIPNSEFKIKQTEIMVIGGGPAGLCAALSAASLGAKVLLAERDGIPGGQLVKQTHKFFGSEKQYAGDRGIQICRELLGKARSGPNIEIWVDSTVLGIYEDGIVTVEYKDKHVKVRPSRIIIATGAAEKFLAFPGNDLPGVYGAGAIQTLMNVSGIKPAQRVLMVGAGNIGLIVSYQLKQAGVEVAAVIEGLPRIGGYLVHASKIRRAGIPVLTRHTILEAYGDGKVEGAAIAQIDKQWQPIPGTERDIKCDTICLAVGLSPLTELAWQAGCEMVYIRELSGHVPKVGKYLETTRPGIYCAGDACGIEEASSAMVEGRLAGISAAASLGYGKGDAIRLQEGAMRELDELRAGPMGEHIRAGLEKMGRVSG